MDTVVERCAGLDIGKADLKACVRLSGPRGGRRQEVRTFATTTDALLQLRQWLIDLDVRLVGMEATGEYWKPVYYLLEDAVQCWLLNARHMKVVPGRKSDLLTELSDRSRGRWVRGLAGLVRFPPRDQRRGCAAGVVRIGGAAARLA